MSWIGFALLSAIGAALVAVFGKIGIKHVDTTLATTVRAVIMAVFLVVVAALLGKGKLLGTIDRHALVYIILSGVAGALSWIGYFMALRLGPTSAVAAIDRTSVVMVFILATVFLSEKFTWGHAAGALLVALGAILMSLK